MSVGIEAINFYTGMTYIDIKALFEYRGLDLARLDNLMLKYKSVGFPCEDPVTNGVNAAKPIIDQLSDEEKDSIKMLIVSSESGIDFGKSIGTYIHDYLGLNRKCRIFEIKQACYGGTAAFQMACACVMSQPEMKVLVIASDVARAAIKGTYSEPSQATGAAAMLISSKPFVLELDYGASGFCSYEVMDTCRPMAELELGNPDLSLLSYLDCLENSYNDYLDKVEGADFCETFSYLAFHTPFAGMVKGGHRKLMRQLYRADRDSIEKDFQKRLMPSLNYCMEMGNVYSASLYLALCSLIDNADLSVRKRIALFSYGSGCSSEFFSGVIGPESKACLEKMKIAKQLSDRYKLSMQEYDNLLNLNMELKFGTRDRKIDISQFKTLFDKCLLGKGLLILDKIEEDFHRIYKWS